MRQFRLCKEDQHWWSLNDYAAVADVTARLGARTVLEFGPGTSTLALIEGGATRIDTCEEDPDWQAIYEKRLVARFPNDEFAATVRIHRYAVADPIAVPSLEVERYDLALIDAPRDTTRRMPVVEFCVGRAAAVLVPLEEAAGGEAPGFLRPRVIQLAERRGLCIELVDTGPLAGAFALLTS